MKPTINKYFFGRHRGTWGIWQWTAVYNNGAATGSFIKDVCTYDEAVREVYHLNGWETPKNITRTF